MTGAPVPEGADAVVMVEHTERSGDPSSVRRSVAAGENLWPRIGARAGDLMVARGTRVNHTIVAIAAAIGRPRLPYIAGRGLRFWLPATNSSTSTCVRARMRFATRTATRWQRRCKPRAETRDSTGGAR